MTNCGTCGAPLSHINAVCDICLPGFYNPPGQYQAFDKRPIGPDEFRTAIEQAIQSERERCARLCRQQADRSRGDHLVPEALMEVEEAILEGWETLEE